MKKSNPVVGRRVATLRCERGMTQDEVASKVGITSRTVGNVEREETMPDITVLVALAELFDVSLDYLVGRTSAP